MVFCSLGILKNAIPQAKLNLGRDKNIIYKG
ncbi:MAG: hypothetical protein JWP44_2348 [Mucilaginibacter sp.]|nr:hypothetical protein [Mucilaginibacter sp.]